MRESPRIRRLRTDLKSLERLKDDSTIVDFSVPGPMFGGPPEAYSVRFNGKGFWRPEGTSEIIVREHHEVSIQLGASYPRMMPELQWKTPIFHPNISGSGVVCLGGYGTYWVPSLNLDELCEMLWDMIRFKNFDVESPYNREAALWAKTQSQYRLPIDARSIRDKVAGQAPSPEELSRPPVTAQPQPASAISEDIVIIDAEPVEVEIIDAEVVERVDQDIIFLD
jgi:hypothetical protein